MKKADSPDCNLTVTEIDYVLLKRAKPNWQLETRGRRYLLAYCISGEATYLFGGDEYRLEKGDLLFFPREFLRTATTNPQDPWVYYSTAFQLEFFPPFDEGHLRAYANYVRAPELHSTFVELNRIWSRKQHGYQLKCRSIILELLFYIFSQRRVELPLGLERCLELIHTDLRKTFSATELAERSGFSPSYFRALFKEATGLSPLQYQNQLKINRAQELLLSGEYNVTETAETLGFDNIYYFSRLFKKLTGIPPSEYRQKAFRN